MIVEMRYEPVTIKKPALVHIRVFERGPRAAKKDILSRSLRDALKTGIMHSPTKTAEPAKTHPNKT